jgi:hypothetical protein
MRSMRWEHPAESRLDSEVRVLFCSVPSLFFLVMSHLCHLGIKLLFSRGMTVTVTESHFRLPGQSGGHSGTDRVTVTVTAQPKSVTVIQFYRVTV